MCEVLKIARSTLYYKEKAQKVDIEVEGAVVRAFYASHRNFGTRKLQRELRKEQKRVSRRRIGVIMKKYGLVSKWTLRQKKREKTPANEDTVENKVSREFDEREKYEVVVSDVTYVKIAGIWYYLCLLLDLCGRKILGSAVGYKRDSKLVETAFYSVQSDLRRIQIFHTDRGGEFKNAVVEQILNAFGIERSLSPKGSPIDNAVAESMYNIIKTEFIFEQDFVDIDHFKVLWFDYVNWYNNVRIHGSLDYMTPNEWHNLA
jgi:transposase InsO family protein